MYFPDIPVIPYEGPASNNPLAFKFYDPERIIMGKPMKEHLPFAMAWWHNLCAGGTDMFGRDTADKSFGAEKGTMAHAKGQMLLHGLAHNHLISVVELECQWIGGLGTLIGDHGNIGKVHIVFPP